MDQKDKSIEIKPVDQPLDFQIRPPGSKSITNRALLCAALADGKSKLRGVLDSDDTRVMLECLSKLGVQTERDANDNTLLTVDGCGGHFPNSGVDLFVENSGTTIRFLTAALGLHGGKFRLQGIERMHQRPIGPLVDALNQLDLNVRADSPGGCPPVVIASGRAERSECSISGSVSSQYLSGLMLGAPLATHGLTVKLTGDLVSKPYVSMTQQVMKSFGVELDLELASEPARFRCDQHQSYRAAEYSIEPDASAASYFWGAAAICGGRATVVGLNKNALQGDIAFVECLRKMGCQIEYGEQEITVMGRAQYGIDIDMADISDTVQTLAVVALFADSPTRVRGVAHNRVKETDRIGDLATELRKIGAMVEEHEDGLTVTPGNYGPTKIATYNDHRMAMSLALAGLKIPGIEIQNPGCTAKTYPDFFCDLERLIVN